ncbi:MAG: ATP-binding protein [Patescibacteria group bacterium]
MKKISYAFIILLVAGSALYCGYQWGAFTYVLIFLFIIILSLFIHYEIRKTAHSEASVEKELRAERDHLEHEVREKTDALKQSEQNRMYELGKVAEFGRLSQGLFHDLMSPLSGLALRMEKIQELSPEEIRGSHDSLLKIAETSKKMGDTLERLRENMREAMPLRTCDIKTEILEVIEILTFKAREWDVEIVVNEKESYSWHGDPIKLHQVFSNIISNALDACEDVVEREKKITILIKKKDSKTVITIQDTGIGIAPEVLSKIYTPYFTTKTPERGSGVGLSIVQKILREIGGEIDIRSTPDVGTVCTITL